MATKSIRTGRALSRGAPVVVVQPAEDRYSLDAADGPRRPMDRLPLCEALVRACFVIEMYERGDEAPEVLLAKDKDVVEKFAPQRAHESFGESIHVGCVDRDVPG
jgi:hypothetical protein